ncbi:HEPN domain-containing protein [Chitinophaga sp. Hz27]|uniref:HEPN domain-containing protein n=1 Tax=Chitinophaga sp. Hz27 TaxID=3347169 RepID=UPI0035D5EB57
MFDRTEKWPDWLNQPFKLNSNEIENPLSVLEDFFDHDHLYGSRYCLWEMLRSTITGSYFNGLSAKERDDMAHFYELLERLIEATYLINEHRRTGKISYIQKTLPVFKPYRSQEDYTDENYILDILKYIGSQIPEIDKIILIKYHSRIDYRASILVLTHQTFGITHEQIYKIIDDLLPADWPLHVLVRSAKEAYSLWKEGNIFFNRVIFQDAIKYDANNTTLPLPTIYSIDNVKQNAIKKFERISSVVPGFIQGARNFEAAKHNELSAFCLHQAVEHTIRALSLSIIGITVSKHNLITHLRLSLFLTEDMVNIFHTEDFTVDESFSLLNRAYSGSRYIKENPLVISDDQLALMFRKVTEFIEMTTRTFQESISQIGELSSSTYLVNQNTQL